MSSIAKCNWGVKTAWYEPDEIDDLVRAAKPGDLFEFRRGIGLIHHWGVYCGLGDDGEPFVVHAGSTGVNSGTVIFQSQSFDKNTNGLGVVSVEKLKRVWDKSAARINNFCDMLRSVFSPDEILKRALVRLENQLEYDLVSNNCEHFVKWCRYGVNESQQVQTTILTGLTTVCTLLAISAAGALSFFLSPKCLMDMDADDIMYADSIVIDDISEDAPKESRKKKRVERSISLD